MKHQPMSEGQLQSRVMEECKARGLLVHHCRPVQIRPGRWATPISGNPGFADLVIAGPAGVIFRELKNDHHQPTPEQMVWLGTLDAAGCDAKIWRPEHLHSGEIVETLARLARKREA